MEEKRKDAGNQTATSSAAATPTKPSEVAQVAEPPSRRRGGGQKRKSAGGSGGSTSTPQSTSSKRQAREKPSAVPHAPIHNGPCTRARQPPNTAAAASAFLASSSGAVVKNEADVVAPPDTSGGGAVKGAEETRSVKEDWEALQSKIEADYEVIRSRDVNAHVVPIPAGWFCWTKVHPLEERALPSFFNGKSDNRTPEIYMEIRNWIMGKFHANPNTQIELKDLSELSVGELDARQEVMEFLDHWGLINYHPFPDSDTVMVDADGNGAAKTDSLVEGLYRFETEQSSAPVVPRTAPAVPSGLFPESAIGEELVKPEGPAYHCNSCSADCSRKRYHCQKQADFDLCTECFNNGKFDSDMSPTDFILMEPAEAAGVSGGKWTDQETLLLLEALELYKENWNEIAEHVATKTKTQCILHFVQMPIEDAFMDCDDEIEASLKENAEPATATNDSSASKVAPETTKSSTGVEEQPQPSPVETPKPENGCELKVGEGTNDNCAVKALKEAFEAVGSFPMPEGQFSFAEAGNPVMALAAFLARLVEPNVATALVRSSLKSIAGNASSMQLATRHCFFLEDPPNDKNKPADSVRAITGTVEQDATKNEKQNVENQKQEKFKTVLHDSGLPTNQNNERGKDFVREEKELSISSDNGRTKKSDSMKDSDATGTHKEGGPLSSKETENPEMPKDLVTRDAKESDDSTPKAAKEPDDGPSDVITRTEGRLVTLNESENPDLTKDPSARSAKESDELTPKEEIPSSSAKEPGDRASEEGPSQLAEAAKDAVVPDSMSSEKNEPEQLTTSSSIAENERNAGEKETEECKNENQEPSKINDDHSIDKMKHAAVTAISAAAVKAKLLADQEEDQIRHLATLLIEKQLHKLETKLAFFSEMESVVMRVREQMERSKQRLYQERAQIIAARLGLPASSSRPMQQSLPINRVAMGFANSAVRPLMNMTSQRPPISRSMMTMTPTSNTFVPATTPGNPVGPTNQDKFSSVVTK